jgi:hypothetical protein
MFNDAIVQRVVTALYQYCRNGIMINVNVVDIDKPTFGIIPHLQPYSTT